MSELNTSPNESCKSALNFCTTVLQKSSISMEWSIKNFVLLQACDHSLESSSFKSENGLTESWKLRLVMSKNPTEGHIGLYAVCSKRPDNAFVECRVSVVDAEGLETNVRRFSSVLKSNDINFPDFIQKIHLGNSMLPNGNLTVRCSITVTSMDRTQTTCSGQLDFEDTLSKDFSKLLKDKFLSDVSLKCGGRQFSAHKCVLSARSPVFYAMFTHDLKENQVNAVEITDIESEALENLLSFIYTDKIDDDLNADKTIELLKAADKYQLLELKINCGKHLKKQLSFINLDEVANAADIFNLDSLKEACIKFFLDQNDEKRILENLVSSVPRYLIEGVLKKVLPDIQNKVDTSRTPSHPEHPSRPSSFFGSSSQHQVSGGFSFGRSIG